MQNVYVGLRFVFKNHIRGYALPRNVFGTMPYDSIAPVPDVQAAHRRVQIVAPNKKFVLWRQRKHPVLLTMSLSSVTVALSSIGTPNGSVYLITMVNPYGYGPESGTNCRLLTVGLF